MASRPALGGRPAPPVDEHVVAAQPLLLVELLADEGTAGRELDGFPAAGRGPGPYP